MGNLRLGLFLCALCAIVTTTDAQQIIQLEKDTVLLHSGDSLISWTGDKSNGQIRIDRGWGHSAVYTVQGGYVTLCQLYYPNGERSSEDNYQNKRLHGLCRKWSDDGVLLIEGYYSNGMEDSLWTYYRSDGTLESMGGFIADVEHRIQDVEIYESREHGGIGEMVTVVQFAPYHSAPHGKWVFYDMKGVPMKKICFDRGAVKHFHFGDFYDGACY